MRAPGGQGRVAAALLCLTALASTAEAASRLGVEVFDQTCAFCHFSDSTERKVGPGLQGLYPRGRLPVSGDIVTDARIAQQIRRGSGAMPPHPHLTEADVMALLGYLRTL